VTGRLNFVNECPHKDRYTRIFVCVCVCVLVGKL